MVPEIQVVERKIPIKKHIDPFDSNSDYDDMPMKMIRKNDQDGESTDSTFDFSFHRFSHKSKQDMVNKLEAVGALELLGHTKGMKQLSLVNLTQKMTIWIIMMITMIPIIIIIVMMMMSLMNISYPLMISDLMETHR